MSRHDREVALSRQKLADVVGQLQKIVGGHGAGQPADAELLERFLRLRDQGAFELLLQRHGPMVLGLCRRLLHDRQSADDAFQATFLVLIRRASSIRKRQSLASWLYKVAYRVALRARADAMRTKPDMDAITKAPARQTDTDPLRHFLPVLDEAMKRLPERYRVPILLCYFQGKRIREAAAELGCPVNTICTRLRRGRELLRRQLLRQGIALSAAGFGAVLFSDSLSATVPSALAATLTGLLHTGIGVATPGLSASAATLAKRVGRTACLSKVKVFACSVVAFSALVIGAGMMGNHPSHESAGEVPPARLALGTSDPFERKAERSSSTPPARDVAFSGRVLAPDGKPVPNSRLYSPRVISDQLMSSELPVARRGTTGPDGSFHIALPPADFQPAAPLWLTLVAVGDGFGPDWILLNDQQVSRDVTFHLVRDQPIRGHILNTEGKPLANIRASVVTLGAAPHENLDRFLATWKKEGFQPVAEGLLTKAVSAPPGVVLPSTRTDADGRFEIRGVGAERLVYLLLEGDNFPSVRLNIVTRPGLDPAPYNRAIYRYQKQLPHGIENVRPLYPPTFEYVAKPARVVEGTVRAADSYQPLASIKVHARSLGGYPVEAVTDVHGYFRIGGLTAGIESWLSAQPDDASPWLPLGRTVSAAGAGPVHVDLKLDRGVLVTGRVIDKKTGQGVRADVRVVPLPGNQFLANRSGEDLNDRSVKTDASGRFRVTALPGFSAIMVSTASAGGLLNGQPLNPYRRAVLDPAERKRLTFRPSGDEEMFLIAGNRLEDLGMLSACKIVDLANAHAPLDLDLPVDPGLTATIRIEDPDGKPLPGAIVSGMTATKWPTAFRLAGSECTIYGLASAEPRRVFFYHPKRKLAGFLLLGSDADKGSGMLDQRMVRDALRLANIDLGSLLPQRQTPLGSNPVDDAKPLTVRLLPTGTFVGRIVDRQGKPVAGVTVRLFMADETIGELYRSNGEWTKEVLTDRDGRFHMDGVIADHYFRFSLFRKGQRFAIQRRIGLKRAEPGATLDLGEIRGTD